MWVADRVRRVLAHDFELDRRQVPLGASIGIAPTDQRHRDRRQVLRNADIAMYRAKSDGGARGSSVRARMHEDAVRGSSRIVCARPLERGELVLHYQPVVDLVTGRPVGVEALVAGSTPARPRPPAEFIPSPRRPG